MELTDDSFRGNRTRMMDDWQKSHGNFKVVDNLLEWRSK